MKIIDQTTDMPPSLKSVVTVGNFDGLHRGHTRLITRAVAVARSRAAAAVAVTFEPHTRSVVFPELSTMLLTTFGEKVSLMRKLGVDYVFRVDFDENFRSMPQEEFVEKVLAGRLRAVGWVMGEGHHVGRNLGEAKKNLHFTCGKYYIDMFTEPLETSGGAVISSTRIRGLVSEGRLEEAAAMLGHPYLIAAERAAGVKVATKLGFPTLNFKRPGDAKKVVPPAGVYAAEIEIGRQACGHGSGVYVGGVGGGDSGGGGGDGRGIDRRGDIDRGGVYGKNAEKVGRVDGENALNGDPAIVNGKTARLTGALYFGDCPTYEGRETHFEFHALGYRGDGAVVYVDRAGDISGFMEPEIGETVRLWLHKRIRPDAAFDSEDALKGQIAKDINSIKKYFSEETQ